MRRYDCAVCHREREKRRHHANREHRLADISRRQRENRAARTKQQREWRQRNAEHARAYGRDKARRHRLGRNSQAYHYAEQFLRRDPCSYCGGTGGHIDHIEPTVRGGTSDWNNLTGTCNRCNGEKSDQTLILFLARRRAA